MDRGGSDDPCRPGSARRPGASTSDPQEALGADDGLSAGMLSDAEGADAAGADGELSGAVESDGLCVAGLLQATAAPRVPASINASRMRFIIRKPPLAGAARVLAASGTGDGPRSLTIGAWRQRPWPQVGSPLLHRSRSLSRPRACQAPASPTQSARYGHRRPNATRVRSVIRAVRSVICRCHESGANLSSHRRRAAPTAARVGQPSEFLIVNLGVLSMIRQSVVRATETEVEDDRSMRVVEWALALIAAVVAGVLAFIR